MHTRPLGPNAPDVSAVGFGGMPLSIQDRPEESESVGAIHRALERRPVLLDTADVYCLDHNDIGHNERLFAKALRSWSGPGDGFVLATKGGLTRPQGRWERDARPDHLKAACERSLRALNVDCIDLYQLHAPDPRIPFVDSVGALAQLREDGKIKRVGLSNVGIDEIREATAIVPVTSVQNRLNPFFREALETGVVEYCRDHGIGFLAYSPMGGGRLNKKLPSHPTLAPIAERHGVSAHAIALAWVLAQASNVIPIPAARTAPHVDDSSTAGDLNLSSDELKSIEEAEFNRG